MICPLRNHGDISRECTKSTKFRIHVTCIGFSSIRHSLHIPLYIQSYSWLIKGITLSVRLVLMLRNLRCCAVLWIEKVPLQKELLTLQQKD